MALLWKIICDLGDPMSLRHPVPLKWVEILQIQVKASYGSVPPCTGWPRPIGSPKLHIIFHKKATKYRSLLRKMTYKDKRSGHITL